MNQAIVDYNEEKKEYYVIQNGNSIYSCHTYRDVWRFVNSLLASGKINSIDNKVVSEQSVFIKG